MAQRWLCTTLSLRLQVFTVRKTGYGAFIRPMKKLVFGRFGMLLRAFA